MNLLAYLFNKTSYDFKDANNREIRGFTYHFLVYNNDDTISYSKMSSSTDFSVNVKSFVRIDLALSKDYKNAKLDSITKLNDFDLFEFVQ